MKGMLVALGLLAARLAVAGIFAWAAVMKLRDPQFFADAVKGFKIFGRDGYYGPATDHMNVLTTFAVPWVEVVCAVLLVLGLWTRAAGLLLSLLTIAFIIAIMSVLFRGLDVKCACFGEAYLMCPGEIGKCHLFQNSIILGLTVLVTVCGGGRLGLEGLLARRGQSRGPIVDESIPFQPL